MEYKIVKFFNSHFRALDKIANLVSTYRFQLFFWILLVTAVLYADEKDGKIIFVSALLAVLFHFMVDEGLLKHLLSKYFYRSRPYLAHPQEIIPIGYHQKDSSFPSSHMAITLAIFTVFANYYLSYWPLMLVFVLFMAVARLHKGLHYPSDILAGTILGVLYGMAALAIVV